MKKKKLRQKIDELHADSAAYEARAVKAERALKAAGLPYRGPFGAPRDWAIEDSLKSISDAVDRIAGRMKPFSLADLKEAMAKLRHCRPATGGNARATENEEQAEACAPQPAPPAPDTGHRTPTTGPGEGEE